MTLQEYNRSKYYNYIRPLFIKNECEICGISENLELHHMEYFSKLLKESLELLNLEYKADIDEYTEKELKQIEYTLLGLQLKISYLTLCIKCHDLIHGNNLYDKLNKNKKSKNTSNPELYKIFKYNIPDELLNKKLENKEKLQIITNISDKYNYPLYLLNWKKVKEILINNNYIINTTSHGTIIQDNENCNVKNTKSDILINWIETEWDKKRISTQELKSILTISNTQFSKIINSDAITSYFKSNRYKITTIKNDKKKYLIKY